MNTTEVQGGSPDVASILKYIAERENNLSKYSDKLRQSVQRIFNVFGDSQRCQVCGERPGHALHGKYYDRRDHHSYTEVPQAHPYGTPQLIFSDEYPGSWGNTDKKTIYIIENENFHQFLPRIEVSIPLQGDCFYQESDEKWYLDLNGQGLSFTVETPRGEGIRSAEEAPRHVLKALVRSGELVTFFRWVSEELAKTQDEYKEVAEIAERMAQAIS